MITIIHALKAKLLEMKAIYHPLQTPLRDRPSNFLANQHLLLPLELRKRKRMVDVADKRRVFPDLANGIILYCYFI